jgi:hypothetical protein
MDCSCQLNTPRGSVHNFSPHELIHPVHTTLPNVYAVRIFLLTVIGCVPDFLSRFSSSSSSRHLPSSAFHLDLVKEMIGEVSCPIVPSFLRLQFPLQEADRWNGGISCQELHFIITHLEWRCSHSWQYLCFTFP